MKFNKNDILAAAGSSASFIISVFLMKSSGISTGYIVNLQNTMLRSLFLDTAGMGTTQALATFLSQFANIISAMAFLALGLAFLASYGYFNEKKEIGIISGAIGALTSIIIFRTPMGVAVGISVILASIFIIPLANTYAKELKKWVMFRTGSNSIGKSLMIINIIIALGIFFSILMNVQAYGEDFRRDMADTLTQVALSSVPSETRGLVESQVRSQVNEAVSDSALFNSYLRWLPIISAFGAWVILELLRNMILSNVGGIFTSILIRLNKKL